MHEGLDRVKIRKHLLIFALAAPVLAILTYFGISQVNLLSICFYIYVKYLLKNRRIYLIFKLLIE